MREQSKAALRRYHDGAYHTRYFVGDGIDIGGKPDPLSQYCGLFPLMKSVRTWDLEDGDAQLMPKVPDSSFDFVHSSHCLEHMRDVRAALSRWIQILKPGGHLIVTVPDEDLYENGRWPSVFNTDHKWSFTIYKHRSQMPRSLNVVDLIMELAPVAEVERIVQIRDFFRPELVGRVDQTMSPVTECAIEVVIRKRDAPDPEKHRYLSAQTVFEHIDLIRNVPIQNSSNLPHAVIVPHATYAPWLVTQDFIKAFVSAQSHTLIDIYRAWELWQFVGQTAKIEGEVLEVGVWRGGSALVIGSALMHFGVECRLILADTFSGVIKASERDNGYRNGEHADTTADIVVGLFEKCGIKNYEVLEGIFPERTATDIDKVSLRMVHVDVDVHDSARDIFAWAWQRLSIGGVIVFDDYGFFRCSGISRLCDSLALREDGFFMHNLNGHAVFVKTKLT